MSYRIQISHQSKTPKVLQVFQSIRNDIEKGNLEKGAQIPSITAFAKSHRISRDTVEKAYKRLKEAGYIESVVHKGYFVKQLVSTGLNVLLVMNKLSAYKKEIYEGLLERLGNNARVDLEIHHYDLEKLKSILCSHIGRYHYYAIMPHFFAETTNHEIEQVLSQIPVNSLVLLDKGFPRDSEHISVHQNFELDIYEGLNQAGHLLRDKYKAIEVIFPEESHHPVEILAGIKRYCTENKIKYSRSSASKNYSPKKETVYISLRDSDLALLVKSIRNEKLELGRDVGILSFNETVLKDLLGISVVTTDFKEMGKKAAELMLNNDIESIRNPFFFIERISL